MRKHLLTHRSSHNNTESNQEHGKVERHQNGIVLKRGVLVSRQAIHSEEIADQ